MQGLTDDVLMPKWYGVVMMGMVAATIHLILPKREDKVYRGRYMGSGLQMVAMLVLTYHLVYALVADIIMMDIPDMRFLYIKGVFDNPTGFALHTCVLMGVIKANRPSSRPPSMGEAFIEITGRRTIRQVSIILVWILTLLSAVMVVLSGCRTGMVCMAVIILLMLYREARRWVKTDAVRLWGGIIGGGLLLAVVLYVFSVKQESTGGRDMGGMGLSGNICRSRQSTSRRIPIALRHGMLMRSVIRSMNSCICGWTSVSLLRYCCCWCLLCLIMYTIERKTICWDNH